MTSRARFVVLESGDVWVAKVDGEIDVSNATSVADEIVAEVTNEPLGLVLDLSEVSYLDSSGVGLLFGLVRSLEVRRQRLVLVVPEQSPLWRLLKVTKLADVVPVLPDRERGKQAVRHVESDPTPA
jgi:anti-anti-sigma factor